MGKKKVVILIDGQNLYYTLKGLSLLEKDIDWGRLFGDLITENDELVRTYWFRAQKILDTYYTQDNIKRDYIHKHHRVHLDNYKKGDISKVPEKIIAEINAYWEKLDKWIREEKTKFARLEYAYDQLCVHFDDVEIVKTGVIKIDPHNQTYIGEKGVDISLAVKMLSLSIEKKCDTIILFSGDYDYAEAIKYVKNNMTKIHIVKVHKGFPPKNKNVSRDLGILADRVIDLYEQQIRDTYLLK